MNCKVNIDAKSIYYTKGCAGVLKDMPKFHDLLNNLRLLDDDDIFGSSSVTKQLPPGLIWGRMWSKAKDIYLACKIISSQDHTQEEEANYLELGAANGTATRLICKQNRKIHITCMDTCRHLCKENRNLSDEEGLRAQIDIHPGSIEMLEPDHSHFFDGCIVHVCKTFQTFKKAYSVTKGGGWLLISNLMQGSGSMDGDLSGYHEEKKEFGEDQERLTDWDTPEHYVQLARKAGWSEVQLIDCTSEFKKLLQTLLKNLQTSMSSRARNLEMLRTQKLVLSKCIELIDDNICKYGIIKCRKPFNVMFLSKPPVSPKLNSMMKYSIKSVDGEYGNGTDVVVVNIKDKLSREKVEELPSTVRLIVSLSAGLEHIDLDAAKERGIHITRSARDHIVKSVADYLISSLIFGLRNAFQNVGVPFPGSSWDLEWNADGVDLDDSKIGFIGMGRIAIETSRRIRALSNDCDIVYSNPKGMRCNFIDGTNDVYQTDMANLLSTCDAIIPLCPLTPTTTGLIGYSSFATMKKTAIFINMSRGKIVDTDGLTKALKEKLIRHAILDTTEPEPLPLNHDLWNMENCTITPHFATNTTYVRQMLVQDISNQVENFFLENQSLHDEEQQMRAELIEAYKITREFGIDELIWNHISVLLSDGSILITPRGGKIFDDIGPEDLVKISGCVTSDGFHEAIYSARSDIRAIVNLHTPATVAISCLEMGFVPLAREAAPFIGRVACLPSQGQFNGRQEQDAIGDCIRDQNISTLLIENHGFCTFGRTLSEAWLLAYHFDKACQTQLSCLQTGQKIKYADEKVLAHAAKLAIIPELPGGREWEAVRKMLSRSGR